MEIYLKKILKILFTLVLSFSLLTNACLTINGDQQVYGEDENGNKYYSRLDAWQAAKNGHSIKMMADWILNGYLVVPEGQTISLDMNGHKIDGNGKTGIFFLQKHSKLNLYGSTIREFDFKGWDSNGDRTYNGKVTAGGLLTHGWSKRGGGAISLNEGASLNAVNIAMCGNYTSSNNYGGGAIDIFDNNCYMELENVTISWNYAWDFAGGIAIVGNNTKSIIKNTTISHNSAKYSTGGLGLCGDNNTFDMLQNSTISYNTAEDCAGGVRINYSNNLLTSSDKTGVIEYNYMKKYGAGVVFYSGSSSVTKHPTIKNLTIRNNYCTTKTVTDYKHTTYDSDGGGVYIDCDNAVIIDCLIEKNGAKLGGGVYVNSGKAYKSAVIKDTTITNNFASGKGGGIFVSCDDDIRFDGDVYVENNYRGTDGDDIYDDVFLNTGFFSTKAYIYGDISSSSRVGIRLDSNRDYRDLVKDVSNYIDGTYFLSAYLNDCFLYLSNNTLSSRSGATTYLVKVDDEDFKRYKVGETVTVSCNDDGYYFYGYKTSDLDTKLLRPNKDTNSIVFTMPCWPVSLYTVDYAPISEATLTVDAPIAGQPLASTGFLSWNNEDGKQTLHVKVSWLDYNNGNYKEISEEIAKYGTDYCVKALINKDDNTHLFFGSNLDLYGNFKVVYKTSDNSYTYNCKADGGGKSATLIGYGYATKQGQVYVNDNLIGSYAKGDYVLIDASTSGKRFSSWNVSDKVTINDLNSAVTSFIMSDDQEVRLSANYSEPISEVTLTVGLPKVGSSFFDLHNGTLSYKVGDSIKTINDVFIGWRVLNQDGSSEYAGVDGKATYGTSYMAIASINEDTSKDLTFNKDMSIKVIYTDGTNSIEKNSTINFSTVNNKLVLNVIANPITTEKRQIKFSAYTHYLKLKAGDTLDVLPKTCTAIIDDNIYVDAYLNYEDSSIDWKGLFADGKFVNNGNSDYTYVQIPFKEGDTYGNNNGVKATIAIIVDGQYSNLKAPTAEKIDGDNVTVKLSQADNKAIKYKLITTNAIGEQTTSDALDYVGPISLEDIPDTITTYTIVAWAYDDYKTSEKVSFSYKVGKEIIYYNVTLKNKLTDGTNNEYALKTYKCKENSSITLLPIDLPNVSFDTWDTNGISYIKDDDIITINNINSDITLYAIYNPIISSINFTIKELTLDASLPSNIKDAGITMKLDDGKFDLSSYLNDFSWLTSDVKVMANTTYIAKVCLDNIDINNTSFVIYDDNYKITVNGKENADIKVNLNDDGSIYFTFPKTDKETIRSIDTLDSLKISKDDYKNNNYTLPNCVNVTLSNGQIINCPITFDKLSFDLDNLNGQTKTIKASLTLPDYVYNDGKQVSLEVSLKQADKLISPVSSAISGEYEGSIYVNLYSLDDSDIYYSINGSEYTLYKDELFVIDTNTTLYIKAVKEGYRESDVNTYTYTFKEVVKKDDNANSSSNDTNSPKALTCKEYMHSKDWIWSEKKKACVYKVSNTGSGDGY